MTDRLHAFAVNVVMLLIFFLAFGIAVYAVSALIVGLVDLAMHYDIVVTYIQSYVPK